MKPIIMTPGPTYIHEEVRNALSKEITNPDLDLDFFEFYNETCDDLKKIFKTKNDILILCGEAILGLEASCASLIEPGDRVLCIDNGIFGKGFGEFANMYGGEVIYYKNNYNEDIDIMKLKIFLENNNDFKIATLVHCETPSGITNNIKDICRILKEYGIITVVDAVSSIGGEELNTDEWEIDILIGGSQKCLSAPPGLTFLSISEDAWNKILNRKTEISSYYLNLSKWINWYSKKWFPYTQPISDIYGLNVAIKRLLSSDYIKRHSNISSAIRKALIESGLELYPKRGFSNTVTAIIVPKEIEFGDLFNNMLYKHNIMLGGGLGFLKEKVFRIGHMGENCYEEKIFLTLKSLDSVLRDYNVKLNYELHKLFTYYV